MRERTETCCRYHSRAGKTAGAGRKAFALGEARPQYAPDLPFRFLSVSLDVNLDPRVKKLEGMASYKVKAVAPGLTKVVLDQIGLEVESVQVEEQSASFEIADKKLWIHLPTALSSPTPGKELEFSIKYRVKEPVRGLFFTGPDKDYPQKRHQAWSQGQDEDNRHWFPTCDFPNQKLMVEVAATVPKGYTAISNGALVSRRETKEGVRFHYKLGSPIVTYLITLAVGEFTEWGEDGFKKFPIQYFTEPGREADGKRAFGNTPLMMEAFTRKIGVHYPYEKYAQVAVQDFIVGGMENASATTQTDLTLHDERAHLDFSSDPLVSHELAHQWFGDLLTCRDWSHGWLNEGFATFMERVWVEENPGPDGGREEAKYYAWQDLADHLDEDSKHYRRAIVCNTYAEPIELFDTHLYQKGGLVLHLIRSILGEDQFWRSIKVYVERHREQNVETIDLIRAIEDVTGRNLRQVFDEWVFSGGYPEFEISYQWHEDRSQVELVIEQKQIRGYENQVVTPLFHLPVDIEITSGSKKTTHRIQLGEARERIFLPASGKPSMVRFDPGCNIPKTLKFPRPKELLLHQLAHDSDCMGRIEAAKELSEVLDTDVLSALGATLIKDKFWGVQAEVAKILSGIGTEKAKALLLPGLKLTHPKARRAVVRALGSFRDAQVAQALLPLAKTDPSYFVEADATTAWAKASRMLHRYGSEEFRKQEAFLIEQANKPSYREVIRKAAFMGLAELPGMEAGLYPQGLNVLMEWTQRGKPVEARTGAIAALGQIGRLAVPALQHRVLEAFDQLAGDDYYLIRRALVAALTEFAVPEAVSLLRRVRELDHDGKLKRHALESIQDLMTTSSGPSESVVRLRGELERLEKEQKQMRSQLEDLLASKGR